MAGRCYQPWRKCYEEFSVKKINHSMIPHRHLTNRTSQVWANSILEALPLQTPKIKPTKNYKSYQMLVYLHSAETVSFVNLKKNTEKLISMLASITVSSPANQVVQLVFMWFKRLFQSHCSSLVVSSFTNFSFSCVLDRFHDQKAF